MSMATKLGRIITCLDGLLAVKSYNPLITWCYKITWQNKISTTTVPMTTKPGRVVTFLVKSCDKPRLSYLYYRSAWSSIKSILRLFRARSSLTFKQLQSVDSLWNTYVTWQENTVSYGCVLIFGTVSHICHYYYIPNYCNYIASDFLIEFSCHAVCM